MRYRARQTIEAAAGVASVPDLAGNRLFAGEVAVEVVLDGGADRDLDVGVKLPRRPGEGMGGGIPDALEDFGAPVPRGRDPNGVGEGLARSRIARSRWNARANFAKPGEVAGATSRPVAGRGQERVAPSGNASVTVAGWSAPARRCGCGNPGAEPGAERRQPRPARAARGPPGPAGRRGRDRRNTRIPTCGTKATGSVYFRSHKRIAVVGAGATGWARGRQDAAAPPDLPAGRRMRRPEVGHLRRLRRRRLAVPWARLRASPAWP